MTSLVLTLQAPMQSWGGPSLATAEHQTRLFPSLSGVCGLLANALGADRSDDLPWMEQADLWARADNPGQRMQDFHTIGTGTKRGDGVWKPNRTRAPHPVVTNRWYLADAAFTVVFAPGDTLDAEHAADALTRPARPLYLGRRSCPPASPVLIGTTDADPAAVLETMPLLRPKLHHHQQASWFESVVAANGTVQADVCEPASASDPDARTERDAAITFDPATRWHYYGSRAVRVRTVHLAEDLCAGSGHAAHALRVTHLMELNTARTRQ